MAYRLGNRSVKSLERTGLTNKHTGDLSDQVGYYNERKAFCSSRVCIPVLKKDKDHMPLPNQPAAEKNSNGYIKLNARRSDVFCPNCGWTLYWTITRKAITL